MEINSQDLKKLKITPSLITLIKAIHAKDNTFLKQLDEVADVFTMARHLQSKMTLKITGDKLECKSFEIRDLNIIKYLNSEKIEVTKEVRGIFEYFIKTIEEYSKKKSGIKFNTFKAFLQGRVNQGVDLDTASQIISMKFEQWWGGEYQGHLNFKTLLGVTHYGQYVQQLDTFESTKDQKSVEINTMI